MAIHSKFSVCKIVKSILLFNNILNDCHKSDEIYYLLNAFRLDKKKSREETTQGGKLFAEIP